jgi:excisionase family DNA binding protein
MHGTPDTPSPVRGTQEARRQPAVPAIFISVDDAALALSLSRREIYRLMDDGDLEGVSKGRRRLVVVESLHDYAKRLREAAAEQRLAAATPAA